MPNITGYSALSISEQPWSQPVLTANGTLGGTTFAVASSSEYSTGYSAWKAFDNTSGYYESISTDSSPWLVIYNPIPLKVYALTITNTNYALTSGTIQASNDNVNWTDLTTISNDVTTSNVAWQVIIPENKRAFFKYYRLYNMSSSTSTNNYVAILEIKITATYMYTNSQQDKIPVMGNGLTLGLTDGVSYGALIQYGATTAMTNAKGEAYGKNVGVKTTSQDAFTTYNGIGVTEDPLNSGLVADFSYLETFNPTFIIKY